MKHLILTTALCLSLTACETVSDMEFPSLNPFGGDEVAEIVAPAAINQSAVQTELDEMERLTGNRMKVQEFIVQDEPVIETAMADIETVTAEKTIIEDIQETIESPSIEEMNTNIMEPEAKMAELKDEKTEVAEDIIEVVQPVEVIKEESIELAEKITEIKDPIEMIKEEIPVTANATTASGCPSIQIIPAAKSITNFEKNMSGQMTSRASITDIKGGCEIVKGGMEIDLDILMRGTVTNKGRFEGKVNEESFVTFPYFVSVIKPDGTPIDKKIMATAMRFRPSVDFVDHAEKITQFVPMSDVSNSGNYIITVGYQLMRKQLDYNQIESAARPNDKRASPDTSKAKRRSVNPLADER